MFPRSTLSDKLDDRSPEDRRMCPNPVLSKVEEDALAKRCNKILKCGFPVNHDDLCDVVSSMIKETGRKTPFTNGRPGYYWFHVLMCRNAQLTECCAERLTGGRATVTEAHICKWFADIQTYIEEEENELEMC